MAEEKQAAPARPRAPSSIRPEGDLATVLVDQWGHRGEFLRGDIVKLSELNPDHYDAQHALDLGVLRLLTEAEARAESHPTTTALDFNLERDEDHARALRFHAGLSEDVPQTITTGSGPAEPQEFAKPTIQYTGPEQPAARPIVVVGSAEEVQAVTPAERPAVPTSSGPGYATDEQMAEPEAANEQRVARRGRARE